MDLAALIDSAVESTRPAADAKSIKLQVIADPDAGPVSGDPARLQQVLWNLLSNAVKYTPKHGRIYVKLEQINSHIEISVSDTGIGLDPSFIPRIFERFTQWESAPHRGRAGLGLGLSIVQHLIEMHGGTVKAESEGVGHGSTFTVALPRLPIRRREKVEEEREHPVSSTVFVSLDSAPELHGVRVLVVDDEPEARNLIREVLELCGATVKQASTAAEAYDVVGNGELDVLVSDIGMPGMDGYALIEKVRRLPAERQ